MDRRSNQQNSILMATCDGVSFPGVYRVIGQASEGWSKPEIVRVSARGNERIGYLKMSSAMGIKNEIELALCQIGKTLGVPMADTIGIHEENSESNISAIISLSVAACPHERFICFREMRDELFFDLQSGAIPRSPWIDRWTAIRARKHTIAADCWEVPAVNDSEYFDSAIFALEILSLYQKKHSFAAPAFQNEYIKMICFDILCGQADRSPSNYGIILNTVTGEAHLAPLFDNSTLVKPYIGQSKISLNQVILDRNKTAQTIYELWPDESMSVIKTFISKRESVLSQIQTNKVLSKNNADFLIKSIVKGYDALERIHILR